MLCRWMKTTEKGRLLGRDGVVKTKRSLPFEDALVLNFARIRDKRISVGVVTLSFLALGVLSALLLKTSRSQTELGPERRKRVSAHIELAHITF